MRPISISSSPLLVLFQKQKVATLEQLKEALGTSCRKTVSRKLASLGYLSSFTHAGRYYCLDTMVSCDELGICFLDGIGFSQFGTLISTLEGLVLRGKAGFQSQELESLLGGADVKNPLVKLIRGNSIVREKISGRYFYFSPDPVTRKQQMLHRKTMDASVSPELTVLSFPLSNDELKAAIILFFSLLDEQQRRLYAGLESLKLGYGGDQLIAGLLGLNVHTVAKGRHQLLDGNLGQDHLRETGGGRLPAEKKRPK